MALGAAPTTSAGAADAGLNKAQGVVALFLEATIRHSPADWVMRHRAGEATPEPEHLREGTALCGRNLSPI